MAERVAERKAAKMKKARTATLPVKRPRPPSSLPAGQPGTSSSGGGGGP